MSQKDWPGSVLSKTPVTPAGNFADSAASGVWSMNDVAYWVKQNSWPTVGYYGPSDPYFYDVTLLLTGDGTNGAQNNTFLDSSSNAFTITRNGNTTQGSFSPYGSLWSVWFGQDPNTGTPPQRLQVSGTLGSLGGADFTVETWVCRENKTDQSGDHGGQIIIKNGGDAGGWGPNNYMMVVNNNASGNPLVIYIGDGSYTYTSATGVVPVGVWTHIAHTYVHSTGVHKVFINGTQINTFTYQFSAPSTQNWIIGAEKTVLSDYNWVGYISNLRIVNGTAVYNSNFTPSTVPLTAITNTVLLTCQSNRFKDNSPNNFTMTPYNEVTIQRFSPFNPTAPYKAATIGGSGYFNGSSYLRCSESTVSQFGTSDFTIEFWFFATASADQLIYDARANSNGAYATIYLSSANQPVYYVNTAIQITGSAVTLNTWHHLAVSRSGTSTKMFVDGVQSGSTYSDSNNYASSAYTIIGRSGDLASFSYSGYLSNLRVVKGTAVYTSNFTPPTSPVTAVSGTSLLLNFANAGIPDAAMIGDYETVGSAQISTSVTKYGTGSLYFTSGSDYLYNAKGVPDFGTGDFTVEFWIYRNNTANAMWMRANSSGTGNWTLFTDNNTSLYWQSSAGVTNLWAVSLSPITLSAWHHVAITRASGVFKVFIDGTSVSATAGTFTDSTYYYNTPLVIGGQWGGYSFNGYLDDVRFTKGYARYTANFTPPTAALPVY